MRPRSPGPRQMTRTAMPLANIVASGWAGSNQDFPRRSSSLQEWVRGTVEDAKEGGSNGVAPHGIAARCYASPGGALVGAGGGRYLALSRLPSGICGHDLAFGQVHAR